MACLFGLLCHSQDNFESLGESAFAINYKVSSGYHNHFTVRDRYYIFRRDEFRFKNRQIDLVHFSTWSLNFNQILSLGIQYRFRENFEEGRNELRLSQQYNFTKRNEAVRFGHRFRLEQRIFDKLTILRYRYRFALDLPLSGQKLDVGEAYFIGAIEGLLSQSKKIKPELDYRTTCHFGWLITAKLRLQLGLEYRFEAWNIYTQQSLFLLSSAILNL